jgi:hypothetical protein
MTDLPCQEWTGEGSTRRAVIGGRMHHQNWIRGRVPLGDFRFSSSLSAVLLNFLFAADRHGDGLGSRGHGAD